MGASPRSGPGQARSEMPDDYDKAADLREIADLRERARRARYVAHQINDIEAARGLMRHAEELECRADALAAEYTLPAAASVPSGETRVIEAATALKQETPPEAGSDSASESPGDKSEPEPA